MGRGGGPHQFRNKNGGDTHPEDARSGSTSITVFIDCDNCILLGSSSESHADSEFLALSALVCWRFFGDSAFPKKLGPQQIPASVDLEDSIIDIWCEKDSKAQSVDDMSRNAIVFLNAAQL